jgi:hypothetical protein
MRINRQFVNALCCLSVGVMFYVAIRGYFISPSIDLMPLAPATHLKLWDFFPSLIHACAVTQLLMAAGLNRLRATIYSMFIGLGMETGQELFPIGTFDVWDLVGVAIGASTASIGDFSYKLNKSHVRKLSGAGVALFGVLTSLATSRVPKDRSQRDIPHHPEMSSVPQTPSTQNHPEYLSYEDLRESFRVEEPRPMKQAGQVIYFQSQMLVSEPNVGIHVFDNSDPAAPEEKYFLNIPGNLNLAEKDGLIYADSFIDLIGIRLIDSAPELAFRLKDVFPWDAYQAISQPDIILSSAKPENGVIIGSKTCGEFAEVNLSLVPRPLRPSTKKFVVGPDMIYALTSEGIGSIDLTNPDAPELIKSSDHDASAGLLNEILLLNEASLFVGAGFGYVHIYSVDSSRQLKKTARTIECDAGRTPCDVIVMAGIVVAIPRRHYGEKFHSTASIFDLRGHQYSDFERPRLNQPKTIGAFDDQVMICDEDELKFFHFDPQKNLIMDSTVMDENCSNLTVANGRVIASGPNGVTQYEKTEEGFERISRIETLKE